MDNLNSTKPCLSHSLSPTFSLVWMKKYSLLNTAKQTKKSTSNLTIYIPLEQTAEGKQHFDDKSWF